jgi:hypothetical protein
MEKLVIDRNIWLRGEGGIKSYLLRESDKKKCCIGILMSSLLNIVDDKILGESTAISNEWLVSLIPQKMEWLKNFSTMNEFYDTNDNSTISDEEREKKLTKLFAAQNIEVEFIN